MKTNAFISLLAAALVMGIWASISAGLFATHVYIPPTPGPLATAELLGIDFGQAIITLRKRLGDKKVLHITDNSLKDNGSIVFITGAGGALG